MNKRLLRRLLAPSQLACSLGIVLVGCQGEPSFTPPDPSVIERASVERIISTLAADDFRGRRAFTEDALRAAGFLANEFSATGIEDPTGEGYLQRFDVRGLTVDDATVVLDGEALPEGRFAVRLGSPSVEWTTGDVEIMRIDAAADMRGVMSGVQSLSEGGILLLSSAQAELFQAISGFLGRPVRTLGDAKPGPSVVLALWDGSDDPSFEVRATASETREPLANVVGVLPGNRSNEYVLFSAHYDHIGIRPIVNGDSIGNGANDDASGTTAVVELARYFASRGTPERTLLFAAFTAEEAGGYGSRYYSSQLNPDEIVAMFNIEMIGKPAVEGPNTAWITGFERSTFGSLLQEAVEGTQFAFYRDPYPDQNLFYRSDNATLARLGVPAHSISTTPIDVDPDYHQVSDEVATLDLDHMTNTIRAIAMGAERIIAGEATPTRVDPATMNGR